MNKSGNNTHLYIYIYLLLAFNRIRSFLLYFFFVLSVLSTDDNSITKLKPNPVVCFLYASRNLERIAVTLYLLYICISRAFLDHR